MMISGSLAMLRLDVEAASQSKALLLGAASITIQSESARMPAIGSLSTSYRTYSPLRFRLTLILTSVPPLGMSPPACPCTA